MASITPKQSNLDVESLEVLHLGPLVSLLSVSYLKSAGVALGKGWLRSREMGEKCPECGGALLPGAMVTCNGYSCNYREPWSELITRMQNREGRLAYQVEQKNQEILGLSTSIRDLKHKNRVLEEKSEERYLETETIKGRIGGIREAWEQLLAAAGTGGQEALLDRMECSFSSIPVYPVDRNCHSCKIWKGVLVRLVEDWPIIRGAIHIYSGNTKVWDRVRRFDQAFNIEGDNEK